MLSYSSILKIKYDEERVQLARQWFCRSEEGVKFLNRSIVNDNPPTIFRLQQEFAYIPKPLCITRVSLNFPVHHIYSLIKPVQDHIIQQSTLLREYDTVP